MSKKIYLARVHGSVKFVALGQSKSEVTVAVLCGEALDNLNNHYNQHSHDHHFHQTIIRDGFK